MKRTEKDLRPSQIQGIEAMLEYEEHVLVVDMGGGKTALTLHALKRLWKDGQVRSGIILAPPLVAATVWPREPGKWESLDGVEVIALTGSPARRIQLLRAPRAPGQLTLYSCSLALLPWLAEIMMEHQEALDELFDVLIVDELSCWKDPRSKRVKSATDFVEAFQSRYGLTGTLRPNGYEDLWNPLRMISGGVIWGGRSFDHWRSDNFRPDPNGFDWKIHTYKKIEIDRKVSKYVLPIEVSLDLPAFNSGEDFDYVVDLSPAAAEAYQSMLKRLLATKDGRPVADVLKETLARMQAGQMTGVDEAFVRASSAGVASGKLSQIVQGFMYDSVSSEDADDPPRSEVAAVFTNPKMDVVDVIRGDTDEPIIWCYGFRRDADALAKKLGTTAILGGGVSQTQRVRTMDEWNKGEVMDLLLHPASAGHGVELQFGGRRMVWYCPTWSSELYAQTVKRIYRPGQTRPVFSSRIIARNTVDEIKRQRTEAKLSDESAFLALMKNLLKGLEHGQET